MIKFLQTGDLHLGLQFKNMNFDREDSFNRRMDLWETLDRMIDYAIEENLDFIFLTGDLYESKYFTMGDIKKLRDILARAKDINILITAGNHDYIDSHSLYKQVKWSDNVYIFASEGIEKKEYKDLDLAVFGYSWTSLNIKDDSVFDNVDFETECKNKILMIHGDIYTDSNYLPLDIEKLESLDMDYIALGHIHKPDIIKARIGYAGCPEPLHFGEIGERGFILGELEDNKLDLEFVDFSKRKFIVEKLLIDESMNTIDIVDKFREIDKGSRKKDYFRIILEGYIQNDMDKEELFKNIEKEFYYIEIIDKTIPDYDLETLEKRHRDNIVGSFIREMKSKDLNIKLNKDALYYGLEVLLKERI